MNVTILNDTSHQNHFGCDLVMSTYDEQLKRIGFNVVCKIPTLQSRFEIPSKTDLAIVNGEGTMHHGNGTEFLEPVLRYTSIPFILLNTVWQDNPNYHYLSKFKYVSLRESLSLRAFPNDIKNAEVIPDIIFSSKIIKSIQKTDAQKDLGITDNVVETHNYKICSRRSPLDVIKSFLQYKRICTGRHHGVCLAAMLGKPFSAWPSNTHKILGMMQDMGIDNLHFDNQNDAIKGAPKELNKNISAYCNAANLSIDNLFNRIASRNLY